jgi:lipoate-protein ligase A
VRRIEGLGKPRGSKLIRLTADIEGGLIRSIRIRGDFFASPEEGFERVERDLAGTALADLASVFDALLVREGVEAFGITGADLAWVAASALAAAGGEAEP